MMDEVKELYFEELKEKNALARSARVCTRKYRGKQYTKKELEQMNGPTYQINLREPLPFTDFKALPKNLQKEYLENIVKTYNVGPYTIAQVMSCSGPPLVAKMKEFGIQTPKLTSRKASAIFLKDFGTARTEPVQTKKNDFLRRLYQLYRYLRRAEHFTAA